MRVLRAMLVLVPMLAFAGWRQLGPITLPLQDVQIVDAGVALTVASPSAVAWHVTDGGVVQNTLTGSFVGAGEFGPGCMVGVTQLRAVTYSTGCGPVGTTVGVSGTAMRFRLLSGQPFGVSTLLTSPNFDTLFSGPNASNGWDVQGVPLSSNANPRTLQTTNVAGVGVAAMVVGSLGAPASVRISVDGGVPLSLSGLGILRDAAPFSRLGAPALIGTVATGGALILVPDINSPGTTLVPSTDAGVVVRYVTMSGLTGMATTAGGSLLGPIPDPSRPGVAWTIRGAPVPGLTDRISCLERWCATVDVANGNVWFYENDTAPGVALVVPPFDAGQTVRLIADAGDGDGDPVFVSWGGGGAGAFVAVPGINDGTQVDYVAPAAGICAPATIDVTVSDGLAGHERTLQVPLALDRGELRAAASTSTPNAGGQAVDFNAIIDGGCVPATIAWTVNGSPAATGSNFSWLPPATVCNADGGQVTITATATWANGNPVTTSSSQVIVVQPWGAPEAPVFPPDASQASGTAVDWRPIGAEHVCSSSGGFPGTVLIWTNYDSDAGTPFDGGLRITAPRTCTPLQLNATAQRVVFGEDAGRVSDAGVLVVDVVPETAVPLPATTGFFISVGGDAGHVFGVLKADAGCAEERGLVAMVSVFTGGAFVTDGGFSPLDGGEWDLPVAGGCSGGRYDVVAELYEGTRPTGAVAQGFVDLTFSSAKVGALSVERLDVVCGEGARAPLVLLPVADACGAAEIVWRATGGPALVTSSGTGATIDLQTAALDFSSVGQQIALEFVADAGAGNLDVATRTVDLAVQPFLEVSVKANPALRREEEAVSLEVTLRNTTACSVDGLSVTLPFSGGSPLLDSVLIDGVKVPARATDQGVVVDGVTVPGDGVATLQLSARARLLSTPTVEPFVSLGGFVVSTLASKPNPATGCGCSELASPAFLALALLVLRRRRRGPG